MIVLDPTDESRPAARTVGPRPADLVGRTVGLLDIAKPRGGVFLDRLATLLGERGAVVRRYAKPTSPGRCPPTCAARSPPSAR